MPWMKILAYSELSEEIRELIEGALCLKQRTNDGAKWHLVVVWFDHWSVLELNASCAESVTSAYDALDLAYEYAIDDDDIYVLHGKMVIHFRQG